MGIFEDYIRPKIVNRVMSNPELIKLRQQWIPKATGNVLEVGIGTGVNLPFYSKDVSVVGVDPASGLQNVAAEVASDIGLKVELVNQSAESLPFENSVFDTAVVTWTLCSIPQPESALDEIRRVLRPNGKLLFLEHGRSNELGVAKWQDRINPLWRRVAGGCNINRQPTTSITECGFEIEALDEGYIPGPRIAAYSYCGFATPR